MLEPYSVKVFSINVPIRSRPVPDFHPPNQMQSAFSESDELFICETIITNKCLIADTFCGSFHFACTQGDPCAVKYDFDLKDLTKL